ncbi:MAG TPA: CPCC family cysteine-rich protein [Bacteroidia bacterium]|jgi:hypothetical protein|nr:CPCC family cysteine-rich protein [Bacteroidia bacterium]
MKHAQGKNGKFKCDCCGYFTLPSNEVGYYQMCPVCYWEDDAAQANDPELKRGKNEISLNEARQNFKTMWAMDMRSTEYARDPLESEKE